MIDVDRKGCFVDYRLAVDQDVVGQMVAGFDVELDVTVGLIDAVLSYKPGVSRRQ